MPKVTGLPTTAPIGLAPALLAVAASTGANADDIGTRLDAAIDRAIVERRIVGTVVIVSRDGHVVHRRAAGYADREEQRRMREDAIFRLGALSKTVVSAAALALIDQGRLGLDEPVTRYLPDFRPRTPDGAPRSSPCVIY